MYIKLLGADASANNLGQIDTVTLDETTLEIMRNMTRFSIYSPVSYELDKFIKTLKENGIWNSIHLLYFPWLAGHVDELLYNPQGVSLSYFINGAEDNLFTKDGIIYLRAGTYPNAFKMVEILMPDYDIQGKFISIGNIGNTDTYTIISTSNEGARPIINIGSVRKVVINGTFNYNYGYGTTRGDTSNNYAGTYIIPSSGYPTGLKVSNNFNIMETAGSIGSPTALSSFTFSTLNLGGYFGTTVLEDFSLTDNSNASYILGNGTLTEEKAQILDAALNKLMLFMRSLAN